MDGFRYRSSIGQDSDDFPDDCHVSGLVEEAKAAFGSAQVEAAYDFTIYHVPLDRKSNPVSPSSDLDS